jgi:hypothetical protein
MNVVRPPVVTVKIANLARAAHVAAAAVLHTQKAKNAAALRNRPAKRSRKNSMIQALERAPFIL